MTVERRFDFSRLASKSVVRTPSGGARIPAAMTRTGVFKYTNADGTVRRELRTAEEVFSADSMSSLRDAPVVVGHPDMIRPDNWEKLAVGHVSGDVKRDGHLLTGCITVQKSDTLKRIDAGELQELSCGYTCTFDPTPGVYDGEPYDGKQTSIAYNHLGLGPLNWARAGSEAALRLDSFWSDATIDQNARDVPSTPLETQKMKVTFDGKEYDKGSDELFAAMQAKLDSHTKAITTLTTAKEKAEGRADAAEQATKDTQARLDGALSPERVDALVSARVDLVVAATKVLGTNVKFDGKSDREIMLEVVKVTHPEQAPKCDSKTDAYVEALFEAGVASGKRVDSISNFDSALETAQRQDLEIPEPAGHSRAEDSKKPLMYSKGGK